MPRFLAIYTMPNENVARFRALPRAEQDEIDNRGVPAWGEWEARHATAIVERGAMVGKTLRVTKAGIVPATNDICGYLVLEAETIEAAAKLFEDHPHLQIFPGETIDLMPFVT
jgi:hypothetical protein